MRLRKRDQSPDTEVAGSARPVDGLEGDAVGGRVGASLRRGDLIQIGRVDADMMMLGVESVRVLKTPSSPIITEYWVNARPDRVCEPLALFAAMTEIGQPAGRPSERFPK